MREKSYNDKVYQCSTVLVMLAAVLYTYKCTYLEFPAMVDFLPDNRDLCWAVLNKKQWTAVTNKLTLVCSVDYTTGLNYKHDSLE